MPSLIIIQISEAYQFLFIFIASAIIKQSYLMLTLLPYQTGIAQFHQHLANIGVSLFTSPARNYTSKKLLSNLSNSWHKHNKSTSTYNSSLFLSHLEEVQRCFSDIKIQQVHSSKFGDYVTTNNRDICVHDSMSSKIS